jgi:hypothetical protein
MTIAAGLSQRINGKHLLLPGLVLFAAGMGYIDWVAHADAERWSFLPGLIAGGIGLGFTWVPIFNLATCDLRPELAGVASGLLNTIREFGGVIASAAIGALLQNRLASALQAQAGHYATGLPPHVRGPFVAAFKTAARTGLEVGRGQTGGASTFHRVCRPRSSRSCTTLPRRSSPMGTRTPCGRPWSCPSHWCSSPP